MPSLKESAEKFESVKTLNVADLDKVPVDVTLKLREGEDNEGNAFSYHFITIDEKDYRVPASVLEQLKVHLEENPKLKFFKVKKSGEGMKTKYTTIPLSD
jgi:hypothetical protein